MSITRGATWKNKSGQTHYINNKQYYILRAKADKIKKIQYVENIKKKNKCIDCSNSDYRVLDFDHKPEFIKTEDIAVAVRKGWSIKRLDEEIKKCTIRCANCHRIKSWERRQALKAQLEEQIDSNDKGASSNLA